MVVRKGWQYGNNVFHYLLIHYQLIMDMCRGTNYPS